MRLSGFLLVFLTLLLSACSSEPNAGRYSMRHDAAPLRTPTANELKDAVITSEPKSRAASRPYTIYGTRYTPMRDETGYTEKGVASWYGRKFHGHHTSNGETYDMFAMSGAHKTLPLPSFVRVTNLDNNKSVIVRVNDRGPFHGKRIIDLSYAAAYKLGYAKKGTANVKIEALTAEKSTAFIQIAAASQRANIETLANQVGQRYQVPTKISHENGLYKLRLGPLNDASEAQNLLIRLKKAQFAHAFLLYNP